MNSKSNKIDFDAFGRAFKVEFMKQSTLGNLTQVVIISLMSALFGAFAAKLLMDSQASFFVSATEMVYFTYFFYLVFSFPLINALLSSKSYGIEYGNNVKKRIDTLPLPKSTIFYAKFFYAILFNILGLLIVAGVFFINYNSYSALIKGESLINAELLYNTIFCCASILAGSIPLIVFHIWLSERKLPPLWNSIALISVSWLSLYLTSSSLSNQWYNFYIYPMALSKSMYKSIKGGPLSIGWSWFNVYSYNFIALMTLIFSIGLLYFIAVRFKRK
ncbi:MAG: ABC transporter permease [Chloroflexota bacterium]